MTRETEPPDLYVDFSLTLESGMSDNDAVKFVIESEGDEQTYFVVNIQSTVPVEGSPGIFRKEDRDHVQWPSEAFCDIADALEVVVKALRTEGKRQNHLMRKSVDSLVDNLCEQVVTLSASNRELVDFHEAAIEAVGSAYPNDPAVRRAAALKLIREGRPCP